MDRHLLITTSQHIYAWDDRGANIIFTSTKGGIVAATEAHDGSNLLAVARRNAIVMHDPRRGREQSWGLDSDEVRQALLAWERYRRNI